MQITSPSPSMDTPKSKGASRRAAAGKALVVFLVLMIALTLMSNTLHEMTIANVRVVSPQRGSLEQRVYASGILRPTTVLPVTVEDAVRIEAVHAAAGATVQAGDPLLTLDYRTPVREAYETYEKALLDRQEKQQAFDWAAADISRSTLRQYEERQQALQTAEEEAEDAYQQHEAALRSNDEAAISQASRKLLLAEDALEEARRKADGYSRVRDYLTKEEALQQSIGAVDKAAQSYQDLLAALDGAPALPDVSNVPAYSEEEPYLRTLTAPIDGQIEEVAAKAGHVASTAEPLLKLADTRDGYTLTVQVTNEEAAKMSVGDTGELTIDQKLYESPITSIAPSSEAGKTDVSFQLPGSIGAAGMSGSMYFKSRSKQYDLLIPLSALRQDDSGYFVYTLSRSETALGAQTTLSRVNVSLIEADSTRAAVQGGISQGDLLAARSDRSLSPGDRVRLEES